MKRKKEILFTLFLVLVIVLSGNRVFAANAASQYTETLLSFPKENLSEIELSKLSVRPNGVIDYFVIADKYGLPVPPKHYQSADSGKTWKLMDMKWYDEIMKRHPRYGNAKGFYTLENGDIYCIVNIGEEIVGTQENSELCDVYTIYAYVGGKVKQIPNVSFGATNGPSYTILNVAANGDILILEDRSPIDPIYFITYSADGTLKHKIESASSQGWHPTHFTSNTVYGIQYNQDKLPSVDTLDTQTGRKVTSVPLPKAKLTDRIERLGVAKNGTMYLITEEGLFRCASGESSFTLLFSATGSRLGNNATFGKDIVCLDDGTIYVPTYYNNKSNPDDPKNWNQGTLYRYSPATK